MSLESSAARAEQMARQVLLFDRLVPAQELVDRVEAVTAEDVRAFSEMLLTTKPASVTIVGAGRKSEDLARRAAESAVAA
jgi:predicted Zn-dependent peptidase